MNYLPPRAPERKHNGHAPELPPLEYVRTGPSLLELVLVFLGVVVSLILVGLGIWKATELVEQTLELIAS